MLALAQSRCKLCGIRMVTGDVHDYCTKHSNCFKDLVFDPRGCDDCTQMYLVNIFILLV